MQRRDVLKCAGSLLVLAGTSFSVEALAADAALREDIETFSRDPSKVAALRSAFQTLKDRTKDQRVGWFNYAAIHGIYDDDPDGMTLPASLQAYWNQCHRDPDLFFIWHRAYLAAIERNLQSLSGVKTLRLPYWDWYTQPSLPAIFRQEFVDPAGTIGNSLYHPRRKGLDTGAPVWAPGSSGALDQPDFGTFQGMLDGGEHSDIHGFVGGDMHAVATAARDPIFFLHHCNIDRLLACWVNKQGKVPDQSGAFNAAGYKFPIELAADYKPVGTSLDMQSIAPLGTGYESLVAPFAAKPPQPRIVRPPTTRRIASKTRELKSSILALNAPTSVSVPAGGLNIAFVLPRKNDSKLNSVLNAIPLAAATSVTIHLDRITLVSAPEGLSGFDVYVNLPEVAADNAAPLKVGTISLFELTMRHRMDGMIMPVARDFRFAATPQFKAFGASRSDLVVSLSPRLAPGVDLPKGIATLNIGDARIEVSSAAVE